MIQLQIEKYIYTNWLPILILTLLLATTNIYYSQSSAGTERQMKFFTQAPYINGSYTLPSNKIVENTYIVTKDESIISVSVNNQQ